MQLNLFDDLTINRLPKSKSDRPPFAPIVRDLANQSIFQSFDTITPEQFQRAVRSAESGDTETLMALLDLAELKDSVLVETLHKRKTMVASKPIEIVLTEDEANPSLQKAKQFLEKYYVPRLRRRIYTLLDATYRGVSIINNLWGFQRFDGKTYYTIKNEYRVDPRRLVFGNRLDVTSPLSEIYLQDNIGGSGKHYIKDFIEGTFTVHTAKIRETNYPLPLGALGVTALILYGLKTSKLKDWLRYCENYGFPMLSFAYDPLNDKTNDRDVFLQYGSRLLTEGSIVHSKDSEIRNLQVASQGGSAVFSEIVNYFEERIIELILMQTNTTRNSYGSGSYANNAIYQSGEFAMVLWDSVNLEETLNKEVETIVKYNFGEFEVYPKVDIKAEPPQDLLAELEKIAGLYALGVEIPLSMIQKQFGISEAKEGEAVLSSMKNALAQSEITKGGGIKEQEETVANIAHELADALPSRYRALAYQNRYVNGTDSTSHDK
jgi:phage gp29-like protein